MKTTAKQANIHVSSQKANLVCDMVRGLKITKASIILDNTPNKSAGIIKKLLNSAIANATNNHNMNINDLFIYEITGNQGKTLKRMMPRAKGTSHRIRKRHINLVITLSDDIKQREKDVLAIKQRIALRTAGSRKQQIAKVVKTPTISTPKIKIVKQGGKK